MKSEDIKKVLDDHALWLKGNGGKRADLRWANLSGTNLRWANLSGANLSGANLRWAKNIPAIAAATLEILPREGGVIGWKKCADGVLAKLLVPPEAKRSNATGRKCRAEFVLVLEVIGADVGISSHDKSVKYRKDELVRCHAWEPDRWVECGGGIHFFLTREEAEAY